MEASQFIADLIRQGAQLRGDGDRLTVRTPNGASALAQNGRLAEHKKAILALLSNLSMSPISLQPLSSGQKALWFLYQLAPESVAYNIMSAARISSEVNVTMLKHAFQGVRDRHPCLRTTYAAISGEPVQVVHDHATPSLNVVSVLDWNWYAISQEIQKDADRPFDLERGPVVRLSLFVRSPKENFLILTVHHIAADLLSLDVIKNDLCKLYDSESIGEIALRDLPCQYGDYVRWQAEMLAGRKGEELWSYWQRQLSGELPVLNLPTDRQRPALQSYQGDVHQCVSDEALTYRLKELAKTERTTLYITVLAAYFVLLQRYTSQDDILLGSPMAGRGQAQFNEIVGYFVNPIVIRADLSGNPTFRSFLHRVRETVLGALEHADYPFPLLVEKLHPTRDPSRSPVFQSEFVWNNFRPKLEAQDVPSPVSEKVSQQIASPKLELEPIAGGQRGSEFDLVLTIFEGEKSLAVQWRYNTDLFDAATVSRTSGHFQTLLEAIVSDSEQRLSDLPMLTAVEHRQLLVEWNHTERDYSKVECLHELIEAHVERTPDAVALVFEDKQLTYRELNSRANQLAHYLRELGIGPDSLVGICVERSLEMVVGLLGILKTGGAYVSLDPAFPKERLAFMLEDAQVKAVVTQRELRSDLPEHGARTICLDSDWSAIARESTENLACDAIPLNRAYVIYTSGSTGKPKGVEVMHSSVVNFLTSMREKPGMTERDVMLAVTTISFDIAGLELYLPLVVGGRVVIVSREIAMDGSRLSQHISNSQATVMQATPATWRILIDAGWQGSKQLKILCGGEALPRELANQLIEQSASLWNMYGPTETTIWSTVHQISSTEGPVLVGRPIANTRIYILDGYMQPTPIGVPGELCIGGAGVARGYLNRPELTEEKFIADPFSQEPGARIYRTGDVARYLADGNIELLGRIDHQVKVRGFRIELGEIEAVLREHPALRDAVVLAREDVPGEKRLVGYVVAADSSPTRGELRSFLQKKLPDYMVPGVFVYLQALPLTTNGKVDRRALPVPDTARPELESTFVAPESGIEKTLAEIWRRVLGVERVGIHDNFFELGGHSLLAMQVVSHIRDAFELSLPLIDLFEKPTVAGLAEEIERARRSERGLEAPPIGRLSRDGDLPLSFAQQRLWFLDQLMPGSIAYNMSGAARLTGPLNMVALEQSLTEVLRRHEILRTTFRAVDGQPFQRVVPARPFILPVTDLQHLPEAERDAEARRLATEEAGQPFDLAKGPLFRVTLLRLGEEDHVLQCAMHHIVSDAWSLEIFNKEISSLYQSFSTGQPSALPELPIQYADFAHWQREWLQGEVLEAQLSYWKKQLAGAPPLLELPTDRPRPAVQTFHGARQSLVLPKSLTEALNRLSRQEGVTLFMTLLAAFKELLCRYTGQEDIVVGSPIAGRNRAEIEPLIGFFINTLVLRTDLSGEPSFRELLRRVREVALGAYDHQELPFEKLVEELQPERDLSRTPLFQVFINMLNLERRESHRPELNGTAEPLLLEPDSKFDLTFYARETNEEIHLALVYNADLFDTATISGMLCCFQNLLNDIVARPEQPIANLLFWSDPEKEQLISDFNQDLTQNLP